MSRQFREPWEQSNYFYDRTDPWPGVPLSPVRDTIKRDFWRAVSETAIALFWFFVICLGFAMLQIGAEHLLAYFGAK